MEAQCLVVYQEKPIQAISYITISLFIPIGIMLFGVMNKSKKQRPS